MTTGAYLDSKSTVSNSTAIEHLRNLKQTNIRVCEEIIDDEEIIGLENKDAIISLKNIKPILLETKRETEATMEKLNELRTNN